MSNEKPIKRVLRDLEFTGVSFVANPPDPCCTFEIIENEKKPKPGDLVSLDVTWPNGHTSRISGKLISICDDEAYVESRLGNVVGLLSSMEPVGENR